MTKNYNVSIEDNDSAFLVVLNRGTDDRLVIYATSTLSEAWKHIKFMYEIETQEFTVGPACTPVTSWIKGMAMAGMLD